MDQEQMWVTIRMQRMLLADLLSGLTVPQWESPSLAVGWRVRDVAAHVALTPLHPKLAGFVAGAVKAHGRFDRLNHDLAVAFANRPSAQLVTELRQHADSRRRPAITTVPNLLFDVMVHAQDIAIPLGLVLSMPEDAAVVGADRVWRMGWPFWARRRLRGFRLVSTDVQWTAGRGMEVRGPIAALLLLLTGRPAALAQLEGAGVEALTLRMTGDSATSTPAPPPKGLKARRGSAELRRPDA